MNKAGCLGIAILIAGVAIFIIGFQFFDRVDPGNAGVLINYCDQTQEAITTARYVMINPGCQKLAEYSIADNTYAMTVASGPGGANDAVRCVFKDQQKMDIDSSTTWTPELSRVADLYTSRPGTPLTGNGGNSIETIIVRSEVRAGIYQACTEYMWEDVYGAKRNDFESTAEQRVTARLEPFGIKVKNFSVRGVDPAPELDQLLAARLIGQQKVEAARFDAEQAVRQGEANLATQKATAALDAEKSTAALAKAKADAQAAEATALGQAAKTKAEADANAYRITQEAEATSAANAKVAASITKDFIEYTKWKNWNGALPTTTFGSDAAPRVDVPVPGAPGR